MPEAYTSIAIYILGLVGVLIVARLLAKPFKMLMRLFLNTVIGGVLLIVLNTFSHVWGLQIGVNPFTAAIVGILGLPGLVLLILLKLMFGN